MARKNSSSRSPLGKPRATVKSGLRAPSKRRHMLKRAARKNISPLDYMLTVVGDSAIDESRRADMAKAAAPYVHKRLAQTGARVSIGEVIERAITHARTTLERKLTRLATALAASKIPRQP